jgi:hypothetical protein
MTRLCKHYNTLIKPNHYVRPGVQTQRTHGCSDPEGWEATWIQGIPSSESFSIDPSILSSSKYLMYGLGSRRCVLQYFWFVHWFQAADVWCLKVKLCLLLIIMFFFFFFWDRVSLCSPGCPGTHFVDQAGLELRNPPASASRVLGLKACATMPGYNNVS